MTLISLCSRPVPAYPRAANDYNHSCWSRTARDKPTWPSSIPLPRVAVAGDRWRETMEGFERPSVRHGRFSSRRYWQARRVLPSDSSGG